jgi:hypothetical protein
MSSGFFGQDRGEGGIQGPTPSSRAVVWMPIGTMAPPPLLESLKRKNVGFVMVHSELLAMAHACSMHRSGSGIMILCEPMNLRKVTHTVALARRYAPRTLVFAYRADASVNKQLAPVTDQDLVDWAGTAPGTSAAGLGPIASATASLGGKVQPDLQLDPHAGFTGGPGLRLSQSYESAGGDFISRSGPIVRDDAPPADVLSADELAMLLGRDQPDGRDRRS